MERSLDQTCIDRVRYTCGYPFTTWTPSILDNDVIQLISLLLLKCSQYWQQQLFLHVYRFFAWNLLPTQFQIMIIEFDSFHVRKLRVHLLNQMA
jgi:hypothetical protein